MAETNTIARLQANILTSAGCPLHKGMRILDVGCGNGETVRELRALGFDAYGCDFAFKPGSSVEQLKNEGRIALISQASYRMPYPDSHFDVLVSNQVMEHVRDYPTTLSEMRRVLKPGGSCLHLFPSRGMPIEPHVFVPLATFIKSRPWLSLWARLGVRKANQKGMSWRDVVDQNLAYLSTSTNFLPSNEIERHFRSHFDAFSYREKEFLQNSPHARGRILYRVGRIFPPIFRAYRVFWSRVVLASR
jgi:ubiquinone/menaquinone biosynthesis C-methylase UbiE